MRRNLVIKNFGLERWFRRFGIEPVQKNSGSNVSRGHKKGISVPRASFCDPLCLMLGRAIGTAQLAI